MTRRLAQEQRARERMLAKVQRNPVQGAKPLNYSTEGRYEKIKNIKAER